MFNVLVYIWKLFTSFMGEQLDGSGDGAGDGDGGDGSGCNWKFRFY